MKYQINKMNSDKDSIILSKCDQIINKYSAHLNKRRDEDVVLLSRCDEIINKYSSSFNKDDERQTVRDDPKRIDGNVKTDGYELDIRRSCQKSNNDKQKVIVNVRVSAGPNVSVEEETKSEFDEIECEEVDEDEDVAGCCFPIKSIIASIIRAIKGICKR